MKVFLRNRCPIHSPATYADDRPYETSVYPGRIYRGACWTDDSPVCKTTSFIPFFLADNPFYGREKLTGLMSQSKALQQQLLYGCWCNAAGLYFDFMRPDDVVPYASIGDSWWWQHYMAIDYGYGNSAAAAGLYAVAPNGRVFKTRERIERKMPAKKFALNICKNGFDATDYPFQKPQTNWLKKLKTRDPEPPRMSFCVMDEAMDQHRGTGQSIYDVMSDVFSAHGVASMKAAHDPEGNAQVLYNGLSSGALTLTRDSSDLPLTYRAVSSRIVDDRKAIKKIHGAWEDDCYDECLAEGTLVRTINGDFPIEEVHVGDLVLTRQGWRRVLWGGITQQNAEVVVVTFSDGKKLIGTKNHPIFVEKKGFVRLNELKYGDKIFLCKSLKLSYTKESRSGVTQIPSTGIISPISLQEPQTEKTASMTFIGKFIKMSLELFPKEWWSTTKTMIRRTMIQTTTNLSQRQSIAATMSSGDLAPRKELHGLESISELSGRLRSLGMGVRRGKSGIASAQRNTGNILLSKNSNAYAAEKNSSLTTQGLTGSVPVSAVQSIGVILKSIIRTASALIVDQFFKLTNIQNSDAVPVHVISLSTGEKGRVYNLTVDGCEEFFAEGVLVHNCSYAWNTWRQNSEMPARTALQQEIEEKRKEGVDETTLARIAWNREQAILADERKKGKGIRLGRDLNTPGKR
jgi:hypothetical protein